MTGETKLSISEIGHVTRIIPRGSALVLSIASWAASASAIIATQCR